jgi:hypothetical protein
MAGYVIYDGPSLYDGERILVYATKIAAKDRSTNSKTGDMAQIYIFLADRSPLEAVQSGADVSTCGSCEFRPALALKGAPTCYVTTYQLKATWEAARKAPRMAPEDVASLIGKPSRAGAYGDPGYVPMWVWEGLELGHRKGTSYTHAWDWDGFDTAILRFSMASIDKHNQGDRHKLPSWARTYRVKGRNDPLEPGEILCPNKDENGLDTGLKCAACGLCAGGRLKAKNIAVNAT